MTARERTLAIGLVSVLLAGGTLLAGIQLKNWKMRVDDAEYDLELRRAEAEILLEQKDLWVKRSEWIRSKQPTFKTQRDADADLLKLVQDTGSARSIEIKQNQISNPAELPGMVASTITVQGQADFQTAMSWLYDLQQPGSFVSVPSISITPNDEDTSQVNIAFILQKWYRKTDS
jgi:hypothetical protein